MEISDEVRQAAQNVIDRYLPSPQRWVKHHYSAANRRRCQYQAIEELDCSPYVKGMLINAVVGVIMEQYPELTKFIFFIGEHADDGTRANCMEGVITSFNDHWSIRYADVRRVLEKVAAG